MMSYSRWCGSRWYTFWASQEAEENRDTAIFEICAVASYTAKQLRDDMDECLATTGYETDEPVSDAEKEELRGYMVVFLADIDSRYPPMKGSE